MSNKEFIPAMFFHWMTPLYEAAVRPFMSGAWKHIAAKADIQTPENGVVADVGCGPGTILRRLYKRRPDLTLHGSDIDPVIINIAKRKNNNLPIEYTATSITDTPFPDATVDTVISSLMFHHLTPEVQEAAFREVQRILKPSGVFLLFDFSKSRSWVAHLTKFYAILEPSIRAQINGQLLDIAHKFSCKEETIFTVYGCMSLHAFRFPNKQ